MDNFQCNTTSNTSDKIVELECWKRFHDLMLSDRSMEMFLTIWLLVIIVFGIGANLLTCYVTYVDKTMHTATNFYLFNLAASDLIQTLEICAEFFHLVSSITFERSNLECQIQYLVMACLCFNGILTITVLAMERYIAIYHPMWLSGTTDFKRVIKIILLIWAIACTAAFFEISSSTIFQLEQSSFCWWVPAENGKLVYVVLVVVLYVIPVCTIVYAYVSIALKVRMSEKNNRMINAFNRPNNKRKVNKLTVALTMSFIVCWSPYCVMRIVTCVLDVREIMKISKIWFVLCMMEIFGSSSSIILNPILFSLMSVKFRTSVKMLWLSKAKKIRKTFTSNSVYSEGNKKTSIKQTDKDPGIQQNNLVKPGPIPEASQQSLHKK